MDENKTNVHHEYDGIVEENNPMPAWWTWLFISCVGFALIYFLHYFSGSGPTLLQEYNTDLAEHEEQVKKNAPAEAPVSEESLMALVGDEKSLADGSGLYQAKCAMCHGEKLQGIIGPNLTDNYWINGNGTAVAALEVIKKGSAAKGMPPWNGLLKPNEMKSVVAYIFSKAGSNPPGAKVHEGIEYKK
jgi:cytochrome c oxidase cbb3-type subunit III